MSGCGISLISSLLSLSALTQGMHLDPLLYSHSFTHALCPTLGHLPKNLRFVALIVIGDAIVSPGEKQTMPI